MFPATDLLRRRRSSGQLLCATPSVLLVRDTDWIMLLTVSETGTNPGRHRENVQTSPRKADSTNHHHAAATTVPLLCTLIVAVKKKRKKEIAPDY